MDSAFRITFFSRHRDHRRALPSGRSGERALGLPGFVVAQSSRGASRVLAKRGDGGVRTHRRCEGCRGAADSDGSGFACWHGPRYLCRFDDGCCHPLARAASPSASRTNEPPTWAQLPPTATAIHRCRRVRTEEVCQSVLRFQRLLSLAAIKKEARSLVQFSADAGYADQAHMTREVQRFSGIAPRVLLRSSAVGVAIVGLADRHGRALATVTARKREHSEFVDRTPLSARCGGTPRASPNFPASICRAILSLRSPTRPHSFLPTTNSAPSLRRLLVFR